jgi:CubicO group peptidase (beta-lactamase class C family)
MRSLASVRCVKKITLATVWLATLLNPAGPAADAASTRERPAERFPAALDAYVARTLADGSIPGLAIAVVRDDSVLVTKGYGVREMGKPELVDENTVFDVASLAKSFTAAAIATLVDQDILHWDDPVRRHLRDLVLPTEELTEKATLRDFLSHRTGLEAANMMWVLTAVDRAEVLRRARHLRVAAPLRERMLYSNVGYTIAGEAAAAAARTSFEDLLRDRVIRPLELSSTTWSYEQAATMPNVAAPHATIDGRQQPIRRETQRHAIAAAGSIQSSARDLARWMRFHLGEGILDGTRLVSDSSMQAMHSVQARIPTTAAMRAARLVEDSTRIGYGMGWQIMDYRGHRLHWHTGNGDGQVAYMVLLPRDRLGVAVVVNTWSAPLIHVALVNRILDTYLGYGPRDWTGETLARIPHMVAEGDSAFRAMLRGKRGGSPPRPLAAYTGRYDEPLFGPVIVRAESSGLVLQMGEGQRADLEYHSGERFLTWWRDPLYRENFTTLVEFGASGDSIVSLETRINRDRFHARKGSGTNAAEPALAWRPSWPRTEIALVSGDPGRAGPFVFRFRMPDGYWTHPHRHPVDARIRVVRGRLLYGEGDRLDSTRVEEMTAGQERRVPAGVAHFEGARGETEIEVGGVGPWSVEFLDPSKDPSSPAAR